MTLRFDRLLYRKERSFRRGRFFLPSGSFRWLWRGGGPEGVLYRAGLFRTERPPVPGHQRGKPHGRGTGKTPVVMALAEGLKKRGIATAVLSRGYVERGSAGPV